MLVFVVERISHQLRRIGQQYYQGYVRERGKEHQ